MHKSLEVKEYLVKAKRQQLSPAEAGPVRTRRSWRLQNRVLLRDLYARIHQLFIAPPPTRIAYTIGLLLHDNCAIYDPPPTPLVYSIHHTILVMAISRKGHMAER